MLNALNIVRVSLLAAAAEANASEAPAQIKDDLATAIGMLAICARTGVDPAACLEWTDAALTAWREWQGEQSSRVETTASGLTRSNGARADRH